ncbi:MAG: thermonuclease family protein [Ardenticatenaceae bacterium]
MNDGTRFIPPEVRLNQANFRLKEWYRGIGIEAIDGDTIYVWVLANEKPASLLPIRVRLFAIDAPEMRSKNEEERVRARRSKEQLHELVSLKWLTLYLPGQKSFDRYLGWGWAEDLNLSHAMVDLGLAEYKEY